MWLYQLVLAVAAVAGLPKPTTVCNEVFDPNRAVQVTTSGKQGCAPIGAVLPVDTGAIGSFCFPDGSLSNNTVQITTKFPFLIRKISLPPIDVNSTSPISIRVSSSLDATGARYYTSPADRDNSMAWTNLVPLGDTYAFPAGLEFTTLSIWPTSGSREPGDPKTKLGFNVELTGCWRGQVGEVRYVYKSNIDSITTSHGSISSFERKFVNVISELSHQDKNRFIAHVIPDQGGNLTVSVLVLPDSDPSSIPVDILVNKIASNNKVISTLKRMQDSITDINNQLCFNKVCPEGSLCVHGKCVTKSGVETFTPWNKTASLVNVRGILASAGGIASTEPQESGTNKLMIPGIISASVFVIMMGLVVWRMGKPAVAYVANHQKHHV